LKAQYLLFCAVKFQSILGTQKHLDKSQRYTQGFHFSEISGNLEMPGNSAMSVIYTYE